MLYDKTTIAIRERSVLEIADISLHVIRDHFRPLLFTFGLLAAPMLAINYLLIGWMMEPQYGGEMLFRYVWHMILLVAAESQLATVFVTYYLGNALFDQPISLRKMSAEILRVTPRIIWCHGIVRGVIAVWSLYIILDLTCEGLFNGYLEILVIPGIVFYSLIVRSVRPFITELVTLEKNPFSSKDKNVITLHARSRSLHGLIASELIGRSMFAGIVGTLLACALFGGVLAVWDFIARINYQIWVLNALLFPACLWLSAGVLFVNRFLSYLDIRTRQEGWAVELQLRAEAVKLETHGN